MSTFLALAIPLVLGMLANELGDVSPWLARRLVHWAAHRRYSDPATRAERAEEWAALLDERPGKFLKLVTALPFALVALARPRRGRPARRRRRVAAVVTVASVVAAARLTATLLASGRSEPPAIAAAPVPPAATPAPRPDFALDLDMLARTNAEAQLKNARLRAITTQLGSSGRAAAAQPQQQ